MRGSGLPPRAMLRVSIRMRIADARAEGFLAGAVFVLIIMGAVALFSA